KSLVCSHCGRTISPREVQDKKVVYNQGNIYCGGCSKDPGIVLHGAASSFERDVGQNLCVTCGAPAESDGQCATCAAQIEEVLSRSVEATNELGTLLEAAPCEGEACANRVTIEDLENGRAEIVGNKTLCVACAEKERAKL